MSETSGRSASLLILLCLSAHDPLKASRGLDDGYCKAHSGSKHHNSSTCQRGAAAM